MCISALASKTLLKQLIDWICFERKSKDTKKLLFCDAQHEDPYKSRLTICKTRLKVLELAKLTIHAYGFSTQQCHNQ